MSEDRKDWDTAIQDLANSWELRLSLENARRRRQEKGENLSAQEAVRHHCLACMHYCVKSVQHCAAVECWLHPWRLGRLEKDLGGACEPVAST